LKLKTRGTVKKAWLLATLWNNFRKQIDHAVIRSVDTAGNIS
jgi:hypothetical protein